MHNSVSGHSPHSTKSFIEIFNEAGHDFYKIDPELFAPAVIIVYNVKTGKTIRAGKINLDILEKSFLYDNSGF